MADVKRQSTVGKVATPKMGGQAPNEQEAALSKAIGGRIRLNLSNNETLEGTLFTADPITHLVAINTATPPPNPSSNAADQPGDYHIVPISRVQSFQLLSLPGAADKIEGPGPGFNGVLPSIGKLDFAALKAREEAAIRRLKVEDAKRGRGVTKEAQAIFDNFARTLPTRWHETSIIVNDSVIVKSPYRTEDCSAPKDKHISLNQVKKVLSGYYQKKQGAQGNNRPAVATPTVPRKGG